MEREARITLSGKPVTLIGPELKAGDKAPDFILVNNDMNEVTLNDFQGKTKLISVAMSVETSVCDAQLRTFNEKAASLGKDIAVLNVTMDLPFTLKKFCGTAGIKNAVALSDYRYSSFGNNYGVLMKGLRILGRSVFIVDSRDNIAYVEIVPEATSNVDFDKALKALSGLPARGKAA
ncbi:MAG: thiol peroxidase [Deltaproteobacteria bacterium]|nr:thiol peroxidase [Deltaproteobacteria bacterium]MBZ0219572.1 thiol peroxidase [Deltaproteobacteria bacterium]